MGYSFRSEYSMSRYSYSVLEIVNSDDASEITNIVVEIKALVLYENTLDGRRYLKKELVRTEHYKADSDLPYKVHIINKAGNYAYYDRKNNCLVVNDPYAPKSRFDSRNWFELLK